MIRDPFQERLRQMEGTNPSENYHPKSNLGFLVDQLYFTIRAIRAISRRVKGYTDEQRVLDEFERTKPARDYAFLCRMGALMYQNYHPTHFFARG